MIKKIFVMAMALVASIGLTAQPIVQDKSVRTGRLSNGLTYYIRHNAKEPHLADFYIAQRVGSILEEPQQRGLAHFLEHMAFNGTRHFPGNGHGPGIVPWCETVGVKFGANLNAYTSVDQTVYNISAVPVTRESVADSCLLILSDWSHNLLLSPKEIDKERGVIREEWRTRRAGMAIQRMMERVMPTVYKGSKYEDCLPIGHISVVETFPYKALSSYYHKWYRPDLQAIIVVGDVDVDRMEAKIKKLFGAIPKAKNAAPRPYYPVPDNEKMIVAVDKDAEQPVVLANLYMKRPATPNADKNSMDYLRGGYTSWMVCYMINARLREVLNRPSAPFLNASVRDGSFLLSKTKDAFALQVGCKQDSIAGSIAAIVALVEQARRYGFAQSEIDRAKAIYLSAAERAYNQRNDRRNGYYVRAYVDNFLDGEPITSAQTNLELAQHFNKTVDLQQINLAVKEMATNHNQVLVVYAPDKPGIVVPSNDILEKAVLNAQATDCKPYEDKAVSANLTPHMPAPGRIVSEKDYGKFGAKQLVLSNGVKVYVKPTNFSADEVQMKMWASGGTSLYPDSAAPNFPLIAGVIAQGGVGNYSATNLRKALAGHTVRVAPFINNDSQGVEGASSAADLKTMMQLAYLYFTAPRYDKEAFDAVITRQRSFLANRDANPKVAYNDSVSAYAYGHNTRVAPVTQESLEKVNYNSILQMYKERFADASAFDLVLVGKLNMDSLRPLLEQYIATLPATHTPVKANEEAFPAVRNVDATYVFDKKQATPSALVTILYTAALPLTAETDLKLDVLKRVLQIAYTDSVREEKGGVYGVGVSASIDRFAKPNTLLKISFRTDPKRYSELMPIVYKQLHNIADGGVLPTSLDKVKKYLEKNYRQNAIDNGYWMYVLQNYLYQGVDFDTNYTQMLNSITSTQIKELAKELLKQKRRIEVTMISE